MTIGTQFSPDRRYRYTLERKLGPQPTDRPPLTVAFIMLNPSTADAEVNDPTVRRCIGYATDWGFERLLVGNLFALRATDPRELRRAKNPVGVENDAWLRRIIEASDLVICAWGSHSLAAKRAHEFFGDSPVRCLATTKDGHPRHPLYLRRDLTPIRVKLPVPEVKPA